MVISGLACSECGRSLIYPRAEFATAPPPCPNCMRDFLVAEEDVKDHDAVAARSFATDEYDPIEYFDHLSEDELFDEFIRRQEAYLRLTQYLESVRADKLKARLADHYKLKTLE